MIIFMEKQYRMEWRVWSWLWVQDPMGACLPLMRIMRKGYNRASSL
jgi:hypothetical protein